VARKKRPGTPGRIISKYLVRIYWKFIIQRVSGAVEAIYISVRKSIMQ
jgi:hypothetical protein